MSTIYLLVHKPTYGSERRVMRAFEREAEALDIIKMFEGISVSGSLEVQPVELVSGTCLPDGWRVPGPSPSFVTPGVVSGSRAELP